MSEAAMEMDGVCPHCGGVSCDKCDGGKVKMSIPHGTLLTRHCNACGFDNGGRVANDWLPYPTEQPRPCFKCESVDVVWKEVAKI